MGAEDTEDLGRIKPLYKCLANPLESFKNYLIHLPYTGYLLFKAPETQAFFEKAVP